MKRVCFEEVNVSDLGEFGRQLKLNSSRLKLENRGLCIAIQWPACCKKLDKNVSDDLLWGLLYLGK